MTSELAFECAACQQHPPAYQTCVTAFTFEHDVKELIHAFKYEQRLDYGKALSFILAQRIHTRITKYDPLPTLLIPVPLHPTKLAQRGFNQAHDISHALSKHLNIECDRHVIKRTRRTQDQHTLNASERKRNVRGAFALHPQSQHRLRSHTHAALIDDVVTTGSTCDELSRLLQQQNDIRVDVWALARAAKQ
ncbi:MAG: ComF family protein [Pseudomonadota bacterium]